MNLNSSKHIGAAAVIAALATSACGDENKPKTTAGPTGAQTVASTVTPPEFEKRLKAAEDQAAAANSAAASARVVASAAKKAAEAEPEGPSPISVHGSLEIVTDTRLQARCADHESMRRSDDPSIPLLLSQDASVDPPTVAVFSDCSGENNEAQRMISGTCKDSIFKALEGTSKKINGVEVKKVECKDSKISRIELMDGKILLTTDKSEKTGLAEIFPNDVGTDDPTIATYAHPVSKKAAASNRAPSNYEPRLREVEKKSKETEQAANLGILLGLIGLDEDGSQKNPGSGATLPKPGRFYGSEEQGRRWNKYTERGNHTGQEGWSQ